MDTLLPVARSIRIEFLGAFYHVMARGNRCESIFLDDHDRCIFRRSLAEACGRTGWRIHAWVLMGNHYHLLVETPEPNLVEGMKWLQNAYTRRFNVRHAQWGRLFGDRYKSVLVEGKSHYYETLMDYIHLNPGRAGLVNPVRGQGLLDYPWSGLVAGYAVAPGKRAGWLAARDGLRAFGFTDTLEGRKGFYERLDQRMRTEGLGKAGIPLETAGMDKRRGSLQRGWYWGSQQFAERVLELGKSVLKKDRHWGERSAIECRAHGEAEARRLIREGLEAAGWGVKDLGERPGSDPVKVALAEIVWSRTTVSMGWIAEALKMRSAANARQQIHRVRAGITRAGVKGSGKLPTSAFEKWRMQSQISA